MVEWQRRQCGRERAWLCSNKTLFTKTGSRLHFADLWSNSDPFGGISSILIIILTTAGNNLVQISLHTYPSHYTGQVPRSGTVGWKSRVLIIWQMWPDCLPWVNQFTPPSARWESLFSHSLASTMWHQTFGFLPNRLKKRDLRAVWIRSIFDNVSFFEYKTKPSHYRILGKKRTRHCVSL